MEGEEWTGERLMIMCDDFGALKRVFHWSAQDWTLEASSWRGQQAWGGLEEFGAEAEQVVRVVRKKIGQLSKGYISIMIWSRRKKKWYVQTVLPWKKGELFTRESKRHCQQHVWPSSGGPKMRFVKAQHHSFGLQVVSFLQLINFWCFPAASIHCLFQPGCPKNAHLDAAGGHLAGLRSFNHPACYAPEGASSIGCLFFRAGEATWAFFLLWNVMPSSLKASVLVTVEIPHPVEI